MVKPTPWDARGATGTADPGETAVGGVVGTAPQQRSERWDRWRSDAGSVVRSTGRRVHEIRTAPRLYGKWGYITVAAGCIATFILMFQHWMIAHGPDGMAGTNAFGRLDSTTRYLSVWSSKLNHPADLTGSWAIAASAAIAVTVAAVAIYVVSGSLRFARIATGSCVLTALLVIANILYLTARQQELKNMTARKWDLGGQLGSWINWAVADGTKPIAGLNEVHYVASGTLTTGAIAALLIAVGSAVTAVATMPRRQSGARIPWRLSLTRTATTDEAAGAAPVPEQPAPAAPESAPRRSGISAAHDEPPSTGADRGPAG